MTLILENLGHALTISLFVFVMMLFIDYLSVMMRGKMEAVFGTGTLRQYVIAASLGAAPGCLGSFVNVSFYVRGLISLGAITGGMLATSGDTAFVMLAEFPRTALVLFAVLFVLGIGAAFIVDRLVHLFEIVPCKECQYMEVHSPDVCRLLGPGEALAQLRDLSLSRFLILVLLAGGIYAAAAGHILHGEWGWERITFLVLLTLAGLMVLSVPEHYLEDHVWNHIARKHLWKIFLWSFGVLLVVNAAMTFWDLETFVRSHMIWVLIISGLVALIPEFGPQLIFIMMFSQGVVPFSVLLTNAVVQDGHGILPLLSYTVRDSLFIKLVNLSIGLLLGVVLFSLGY